MNHYEFLNVPRDAPAAVIDDALREQERRWFYRQNSARNAKTLAQAQEVLARLNEIRATLLDAARRSSYDATLPALTPPKRSRRRTPKSAPRPVPITDPIDQDSAPPSEPIPDLAPDIVTFVVTPVLVKAGGEVEIRWEVAHATTVRIVGLELGTDLPAVGTLMTQVDESRHFEIVATGPGGTVHGISNVVEVEHDLQIVEFGASPTIVIVGDPLELTWKTLGASSVRILELDHLGALAPEGTHTIAAATSQQFTLHAYGSVESATAQTEFVRVLPMPALTPVKVPIPSVNTVLRLTGDLTRLARLAPAAPRPGPIRAPEPPPVRAGRRRQRLTLPLPPDIPGIPDFLTSDRSNES